MDHANLLHYQHPQKVNRRVARYILTLADYNIQLHHRARPMNRADELSRRPDYNNGKEDNKEVTPLPTALFTKSITLDHSIKEYQNQNPTEVEEGKEGHPYELVNELWRKDGRIFIPNDTLR